MSEDLSKTAGPEIERPKLTMPPAEAELVRASYLKAETILEYGSGGSTVVAGEMIGKTVFSVESDRNWVAMMRGWFAQVPPISSVHLHHVDIGPTGEWGAPVNEKHFRRWPEYPTSVWDRDDFQHPDVVLIDGRFRVACLLTVALRITRPIVALFDDYAHRKPYHEVEAFLRPTGLTGRMALFEMKPQPFPVDRMGWIMKFFTRPA